MKTAVYSGSRNLYPCMATAAKSLIANSSVERVVFLIEDAEYPIDVPDIIETIDVSGQKWFPPSCPHMKKQFTYMSLLRVCYTKILPDTDKVLQLDVDTVVVDDIDPLFDMDMGSSLFAAVREPARYFKDGSGNIIGRSDLKVKKWGELYYNIGVAMFNLAQIRKEWHRQDEKLVPLDDFLIAQLNDWRERDEYRYIDQDVWNKWGSQRCIDLDPRYNECCVTEYSDSPAIVHYAGYGNAWYDPGNPDRRSVPRLEHLRVYREMGWDEVMKKHAAHKPKRGRRKANG